MIKTVLDALELYTAENTTFLNIIVYFPWKTCYNDDYEAVYYHKTKEKHA